MTEPNTQSATAISLGDPTSQIRIVQQLLRGSGRYNGPIDGKTSPEYERALSAWQKENKLVATGHVDFATANLIAQAVGSHSGHLPAGFANVDQKVREEVTKRYGPAMASYLNSPIGQIIVDAAKGGKDQQWLFGLLSQNSYWRNLSTSAKQWDQLKIVDPGEAQSKLQVGQALISDMARRLGLTIDGNTLLRLADDANRYGWLAGDRSLMQDILVNTVAVTGKFSNTGTYRSTIDSVKAQAARYLINISDESATNYATRMLKGELDDNGMQAAFVSQAKALFPSLKDAIEAGTDPHTILDPYRQAIARELDLAPDQVDFVNGGKWRDLLNYKSETDKTPRLATIDEALNVARQDPRWWKTTNGRQRSANAAMDLAKSMGAIA